MRALSRAKDAASVEDHGGARRCPLPEGVAQAPRHQHFTGADLLMRFVSSGTGESFSQLREDSTADCLWRCSAGHEYRESRSSHRYSRGCPICAVSVATRMPGLLRYWDEAANDQPATDVSAYSREKAHWVCEHGHRFERPPYRVLATGHQCQECRRQGHVPWCIAGKSQDKISLVEARPDIAAEWDYEKNARDPSEFAPGSQRVAYWICPNGHSWSSPICHRTSTGRHPASCQRCKAIAFSAPELAAQLHPTLNPEESAYRVRKGSSEVLYWQCERGHTFTASVAARLRTTYPASCEICRSIAMKAPELIHACWAYELNVDLDPENLKTSSTVEAWWLRVSSLDVPVNRRTESDYEQKRIGYRYRRFLNNSQQERYQIRDFLETQERATRKASRGKPSAPKGRKTPSRRRKKSA